MQMRLLSALEKNIHWKGELSPCLEPVCFPAASILMKG